MLSSTASVYGEPESTPIDEDHRLEPNNPYGESKLMIEKVLRWYDEIYGIRWVALRYFNACGALEDCGEELAESRGKQNDARGAEDEAGGEDQGEVEDARSDGLVAL